MSCCDLRCGGLAAGEPLLSAIPILLQAFIYSEQTSGRRWEFAVEIERLRDLGLDHNDLRWLVRMGYVEHGQEVTLRGHDSRRFRPTGDLIFTRQTCFVLTNLGVQFAQSVCDESAAGAAPKHSLPRGEQPPLPALPSWDAETRELTVSGRLVKRFKWQAVNQEIVLGAFQEDGWPVVIDDPLPPKLELDSKRRLHDTIKALNRNQEQRLLRFHGNGTGEGIRWELLAATKNHRHLPNASI